MIEITPQKASCIASIVDGTLSGSDAIIDKISLSSKEKGSDWCFIAIKGKKFNGNDFIKEAISNGAKLVITDERIKLNATTIYVENTVKALGNFAKSNIKNTKIIAITGSVGKTTTKEMIISVLKQKFSVCGTKDNENNDIGVPLTLLSIKKHDFCVVEMGMRAKGEIEYLSSLCTPECAIITNCGTSHIELLKTKDGIFSAKTEILKYAPKYAILPNEKRFKKLSMNSIKAFFINEENCKMCEYKYSDDGIVFSLRFGDEIIENINLKSFYIHNIYNSMIAFTVGKIYGINNDEIKNGIESFIPSNMRGEHLDINGISIINDCYNSSFESMKSALVSFKSYAKIKGKVPSVLIGDILEAGNESISIHRVVGKLCKELEIKHLFVYGKYAPNVIDGFGGGIIFSKKENIAPYIIRNLGKEDTLLVKASRGMHFERIIEEMKEIRNE